MSEEKTIVEVPEKFKALVEQIEKMSVLDLSELVKVLEDKFGVSAAAPAMMMAAAPAGEAAPAVEEKTELLKKYYSNNLIFTFKKVAERMNSVELLKFILSQKDIEGGTTIEQSAQLFVNIISGKGTEAQNNVVCANAGMAIATVKKLTPLQGFELAKESLLSGKGLKALKKLKDLSI